MREKDETNAGFIPGAVLMPRGFLEMQAESKLPDKNAKIVVYCAGGTRSAFAAKALSEMGYEHVESANPGFVRWKDMGYPVETPAAAHRGAARPLLAPPAAARGRREGAGEAAQVARAAARRGRARLAGRAVPRGGRRRHDRPGRRRHRRRVEPAAPDPARHRHASACPRSRAPRDRIQDLNPDVKVVKFQERLNSENIDRIFDQGWDVIVDGLDNFPTRYLVNDASVWKKIPVVHGSIFRFDGQVTTFDAEARARATAASIRSRRPRTSRRRARRPACSACCPASSASIQATEAIKLILGRGEPLIGRLLTYDSLKMTFRTLQAAPRPELPGVRREADHHKLHRLRRLLRERVMFVGRA